MGGVTGLKRQVRRRGRETANPQDPLRVASPLWPAVIHLAPARRETRALKGAMSKECKQGSCNTNKVVQGFFSCRSDVM